MIIYELIYEPVMSHICNSTLQKMKQDQGQPGIYSKVQAAWATQTLSLKIYAFGCTYFLKILTYSRPDDLLLPTNA